MPFSQITLPYSPAFPSPPFKTPHAMRASVQGNTAKASWDYAHLPSLALLYPRFDRNRLNFGLGCHPAAEQIVS